tara:strand:- start:16069 stop:16533 length:465 start_codon:yes stop_codon:yes gene_type:complete
MRSTLELCDLTDSTVADIPFKEINSLKYITDSKMKFGIFGGSIIASSHAQAIEAMETSSVAVKELATRFSCKAYSDEKAFFADPKIEMVTIATPYGAHLEPKVKAAKAGKHIIFEKPIEISNDRIDKMITVAQEAGVPLPGIFNRRFNSALEAL